MIGALPEYKPPPMLYCAIKNFYCNGYREDPCVDCVCPYHTLRPTKIEDESS